MIEPVLPCSLVLRSELRSTHSAMAGKLPGQESQAAGGPEPKAVSRDQGVEGRATSTAPGTPGPTSPLDACSGPGMLPILIMLPLMYFLMIRPQMRTEKERKAMLGKLKKGDRVVTSGGMHGEVVAIRDTEVTLRIGASDRDLRVVFDRSGITRVVVEGKSNEGKTSDAEVAKPDAAAAERRKGDGDKARS